MSKIKKGINAWCFPENISMEQIFKTAKDCNYDGVEINMKENATDGLAMNMSEAQYEQILSLSKKYRIPVPSISTGLHWQYPLTSTDERIREIGKNIVRKMIEAAAFLGADTVLVVPGLVTPEVSYQAAYDRALSAFRDLKDFAEQKKVIIGIENVWNKFLLSPLEMARFIDEIGSDYVKAYFDAGNVLQFSYPEHWVEALGRRIAKVHVKDFDVSIGNISGFKPLLQGDMDWGTLIKALDGIGYESYITAELSPYNTNPLQLIKDTSEALDYIVNIIE